MATGRGRRDSPEAPREAAFPERVDFLERPALSEVVDQSAGEEVDGEAAVLPGVVTVPGAGSVVRVPV